jgi:predicted RNA-binding Zn ribbon-like protein
MNTVWADRDGIHDALTGRTDASAWLHAIAPRTDFEIPKAAPPADQIERLRTLRDALRRIAAEATQDPRTRAASEMTVLSVAVKTLNAAAAETPSWPALRWNNEKPTRLIRTTTSGTPALVCAIAQQAVEMFAGDSRHQLRACLAPGCVLYFVKDHPRREWCSAGCGNRARVARHYRRHHSI